MSLWSLYEPSREIDLVTVIPIRVLKHEVPRILVHMPKRKAIVGCANVLTLSILVCISINLPGDYHARVGKFHSCNGGLELCMYMCVGGEGEGGLYIAVLLPNGYWRRLLCR